MEALLLQFTGKTVDISCGANVTVRGDVLEVKNGILYLRDDSERTAYVAVEKIAIVRETKENQSRPGFLG